MFWSKKEKGGLTGNYRAPMFNLPLPRKKEFLKMQSILNDIEKYDDRGDIDVRNRLLDSLAEQIDLLKNKETSKYDYLIKFGEINSDGDVFAENCKITIKNQYKL